VVIIIDSNEIQITWEYFEKLYSNKLENLKGMNKFPDTYDLPKLNQAFANNLSRAIEKKEIKAMIKSLSKKNQMDSLLYSTRPLKKSYIHAPQTIPLNRKGRSTVKLIMQSVLHLNWMKT
jgi:hypothetical protein